MSLDLRCQSAGQSSSGERSHHYKTEARWRRKLPARAKVLSDEGRITWRLKGDRNEGEKFVAGGQRGEVVWKW